MAAVGRGIGVVKNGYTHPAPARPEPGAAGRYGRAAFVDVETTGLDPASDEIVELAIVLFAFDRETGTITGILDEYTGLREPSRPIPRQATAVHGITQRMVRGRRLDDARVRALLEQAEFLVAHNARFDRAFVTRLYPETAAKVWLCSMRGVDWRRHGHASRALQNLLAAHGIRVERAHRAGADCRAALALLSCRGRDGDTYLQELLRGLEPRAAGTPAAGGKAAAGAPTPPAPAPSRHPGRPAAGCATLLVLLAASGLGLASLGRVLPPGF